MEHFRKRKEPLAKIKPLYYRWTFRPSTATVDIDHNHDTSRAERKYHLEKAAENPEPDLVHGYAYRIKGGWRITSWDHKEVDKFIKRQVMLTIERKENGS